MCPRAMPFEGITIKKSNMAEGTQQLHTQMDVVHMSADGSMGG